jgi:hypothetical protein
MQRQVYESAALPGASVVRRYVSRAAVSNGRE